MGVGDAGHGVGHARPGGDHRHAEAAGDFRLRLRHVRRGAFVADVDDAESRRVGGHPDRHDMAAAQREEAFDPARREKGGDGFGDGHDASATTSPANPSIRARLASRSSLSKPTIR